MEVWPACTNTTYLGSAGLYPARKTRRLLLLVVITTIKTPGFWKIRENDLLGVRWVVAGRARKVDQVDLRPPRLESLLNASIHP